MTDTLPFQCPRCQAAVTARRADAGSRIFCPSCQNPIKVPGTPPATKSQDDWGFDSPSAPPKPAATPSPKPKSEPVPPTPSVSGPTELSADPLELDQLAAAIPPAKRPAKEEPFGFECLLCGTRLYALPSEIGKQKKCPDCHTQVTIKRPPAPLREMTMHPAEHSEPEEEFRLSDAVAQHTARELVSDPRVWDALKSPQEKSEPRPAPPRETPASRPSKPTPSPLEIVQDQVRKAEAEAADVEAARPVLPPRPFRDRLLDFAKTPGAGFHLLLLTGAFTAVRMLVFTASGSSGGVMEQVMMLLSTIAAIVLGIVVLANVAITVMTIVVQTAHGRDEIENWPIVPTYERMAEAAYVGASLAGALPGFALSMMLSCAGLPKLGMPLCLLSGFAFFPIALLSTLQESSPLTLYSPRIVSSLTRQRTLWKSFYMHAGVVMGVAFVGLLLMNIESLVFVLLGSAVTVAALMVYCRLLGRLAWSRSDADQYEVV